MKTDKRIILIYIILISLLIIMGLVNLCVGPVRISVREIADILRTHDTDSVNGVVVWSIRFPRTIAAAVLGGALALSGYLLQAFFSNPVAGPFVMGISSGAKLVVAVLMVEAGVYGFAVGSWMMIGAAFTGAVISTVIVILASRRVRNMAVLIVCGIMIGYVCSAVTELIVAFADDSNIVNLHNWSMGTFASISWQEVYGFIPVIAAGCVLALVLSKPVEAYLYGEAYAYSLGIPVRAFRVLLILTSSILSATVTAFAGPISFVGIAVPHVIKLICKSSKPLVIMTASFLGGSVFCLICDLIARYAFAPMELSISTITAVFGAPIVISMLLHRRNAHV